MIEDILKAFLVGVAASVPIGPIAILVIQKTLSKGFWPGFITSLGSTVVDTVFAVVSMFALTFVQDFIEGNRIVILIVGGLIVVALGISMALSNPFKRMQRKQERYDKRHSSISATDFLKACAMGLSNPGAIAVMLALMAFFGLCETHPSNWSVFPIILAIAVGSASYWFGLTALINMFRKKITVKGLILVNRITGAVVIVLGMATFAEGIMRLFI